MAADARTRFASLKMYDGETVLEIQHKFDGLSNECAIQGVPLDEAVSKATIMPECWTSRLRSQPHLVGG